MMTDCLSLFDILTKTSVTSEKLLLSDLKTFNIVSNNTELQNVAFIQSEFNRSDGLTKSQKESSSVWNCDPCRLDYPSQQQIMRYAKGDFVVTEWGVALN